jgi:hypothetical protein
MMQMRKILRRKVSALEGGTILSDDVFDDLLRTDASHHDKEDEGTNSSIFEAEDIGPPSGGEADDDLISKKVGRVIVFCTTLFNKHSSEMYRLPN